MSKILGTFSVLFYVDNSALRLLYFISWHKIWDLMTAVIQYLVCVSKETKVKKFSFFVVERTGVAV